MNNVILYQDKSRICIPAGHMFQGKLAFFFVSHLVREVNPFTQGHMHQSLRLTV